MQSEVTKQTKPVIIYKILLKSELEQFDQTKEFVGSNMDKKDGYIHMCSTLSQIDRVKGKYYKDVETYLLQIDSSKLDNLKYETISNGDIYPHQYGKLLWDQVIEFIKM